jgi:hypothetical protein
MPGISSDSGIMYRDYILIPEINLSLPHCTGGCGREVITEFQELLLIPELDGTDFGDETASVMFNIAKWDVFSNS